MLLIRQCHVISTPGADCFVLKLAQASICFIPKLCTFAARRFCVASQKLWPGQANPPPPPHPSAVPLAPSVSWFPHCHYICSYLRRVHHPLACAMRSGCKARCPRVEINDWGHLALQNCPVNFTIQNTGASSPPPPPPLFFHGTRPLPCTPSSCF